MHSLSHARSCILLIITIQQCFGVSVCRKYVYHIKKYVADAEADRRAKATAERCADTTNDGRWKERKICVATLKLEVASWARFAACLSTIVCTFLNARRMGVILTMAISFIVRTGGKKQPPPTISASVAATAPTQTHRMGSEKWVAEAM